MVNALLTEEGVQVSCGRDGHFYSYRAVNSQSFGSQSSPKKQKMGHKK